MPPPTVGAARESSQRHNPALVSPAVDVNFARTKIQPPRPRGGTLVERPELEARLGDALLEHRLVLVVAAAGYGKTAALTRQIERLPPGVALAWVSADEGDDLHRLLDCLIAALEPWDPPWRTAPEALMALAARPGNGALQAAATELLNTLDTTDTEHGVIVLDDLHRVDDASVYEFLNLVLARLGARWTVAIAARHDPPLALARLRAQGELAEFRQADLQFARSETRALAGLAGLDEATADALLARTQGWAAGLRLALNGARGGTARASAIDRHVFEFLASEVIDRLDPELQDFLLQTSVLAELSAPRCAAVTGNPEAPALLERVDRLCLFASCLAPGEAPDEAPTLRLHDLFREALEHRLARHDPQALPRLLRRAADSESDPLRRVNLLLRAADLDGAAKVLREHAPTWLTEGALSTVGRLIDRFPTAWREASPELLQVCGLYAWARWDYYAMDDAMRRAEAASRTAGDDDGVQAALAYQSIAASGLGRLGDNGPRLAVLRREVMRPETRAVVLVACLWHALDLGSVHRVGPLLDELIDLVEGSTDVSLWYRAYPIARINGLPGTQRALDRYVEGALRLTTDRPTVARALALTQRGWREAWAGHMDNAVDTLAQARADATSPARSSCSRRSWPRCAASTRRRGG
jgi:LuxR family transcriptional regulator, maltose regulon positive regulatory protein